MAMSKLKKLRLMKELTQDELSLKCNVAKSSISRYETGGRKLPVDVAKRIAKVLDVPWNELY